MDSEVSTARDSELDARITGVTSRTGLFGMLQRSVDMRREGQAVLRPVCELPIETAFHAPVCPSLRPITYARVRVISNSLDGWSTTSGPVALGHSVCGHGDSLRVRRL